MSELLFDLIELVVEVLISAADSSSSNNKRNGGARTNFLTAKNPRSNDSFYVARSEGTLKDYVNPFEQKTTTTKPITTPKVYTSKVASKSIENKKFVYDTPEEDANISTETSQNDETVFNSQVNQMKLEILLLSYMFKEDDGKISGSEKRAIKKHFSKFKGILSADDIKEIKQFDGMDKSLMNIRAFISQNHVTEGDISDAIRTIKEVERDSDRYRSVISRIESALLETMGY